METCPQCGAELQDAGPEGLCGVCLLGGALGTMVSEPVTQPNSTDEVQGFEHDNFGPYRILHVLGEGGMGTVYLAEQTAPIKRTVALKVVKLGMDTKDVLSRFAYERQAVALMDHPHIAHVYDANASDRGRPFFVMEYVDGSPITRYCDQHRLTTIDRLRLFLPVCTAVQHAHQKGVLHRDLKPSNVLVTEVDGHPVPKIIDFGVAKALNQKLTPETMFTRVGAIVGTPEYMSPEQALSSGEDIDTRTDVYSLGVIFYELLVGARPFDARKIAFDEFLRRLREEDPPKPSTKLRTQDSASSIDLAGKRRTEPPGLSKLIRGDLDCIALKALEKDRSRRYGSPSDFAADIQRHLNNEAVSAVPPSAAYRARKFASRYRVALATVAAFALVLILAAAISIRQGIRASREAAVAQAVTDFLENDVLAQASASSQAGPSVKPNPHLEVRTALDRAASRIARKFDRQPEVEASIRHTIGRTYTELGLYPEARKQLDRALELRRKVLGATNPKTLQTSTQIAMLVYAQGMYAEAGDLYRQNFEVQRRVLGSEHPDTLWTMECIASTLYIEGKYGEAESIFRKIVEIRRRLAGSEHPNTLFTMACLAYTCSLEGKYDEAESLSKQTIEIQRRVLGPEHPNTLWTMNALADTYISEGKYGDAEALHERIMEIRRRVLGPEASETLSSMDSLARTYSKEGKYAKAEELDRQTLEIERRVLGPENPDTLSSLETLALILSREGRYDEAERLFSEAIHKAPKAVQMQAWYNFACGAAIGGHRDEALQYLRGAIDHGFQAGDVMAQDPDLKSLQGDPRFEALVAKTRQAAAANRTERVTSTTGR